MKLNTLGIIAVLLVFTSCKFFEEPKPCVIVPSRLIQLKVDRTVYEFEVYNSSTTDSLNPQEFVYRRKRTLTSSELADAFVNIGLPIKPMVDGRELMSICLYKTSILNDSSVFNTDSLIGLLFVLSW